MLFPLTVLPRRERGIPQGLKPDVGVIRDAKAEALAYLEAKDVSVAKMVLMRVYQRRSRPVVET
jgi:hypothetical protein